MSILNCQDFLRNGSIKDEPWKLVKLPLARGRHSSLLAKAKRERQKFVLLCKFDKQPQARGRHHRRQQDGSVKNS